MLLQFPDTGYYGDDTAGHCRRVAALARRVGSRLPLTEAALSALQLASLVHEIWTPVVRKGELSRLIEIMNSRGRPSPPNDCVEEAQRILSAATTTSGKETDREQTWLAAEILEACNAFDEAVEFAAHESVAPVVAMADFHREFGARLSPCVGAALAKVTVPEPAVWRRDHLPVMPRAASGILRTSDETTSPAELHLIAASDPVLCGRLLQVANSARFGSREPVSRITDAAARLGVPLARKVLLSACFAPLFASKPLQDLWKHSQQVAAATSVAAHCVSFNTDVAYAAGLLHDVGRLVFETGSAASLIKLRDQVRDGFPLTYAETLTYGKDHARTGADVLREWELPEVIGEAVENHHQPERSDSLLGGLVFLAEECCRRSSNSAPEGLSVRMRLAHAEELCGLSLDTLAGWRSEADLLALAG